MSSATPATIAKAAISPMIAASVTGGGSSAENPCPTPQAAKAAAPPPRHPQPLSPDDPPYGEAKQPAQQQRPPRGGIHLLEIVEDGGCHLVSVRGLLRPRARGA